MKKNPIGFLHQLTVIALCLAVLSGISTVSGCSLAQETQPGKSNNAGLCGRWVVFGDNPGEIDLLRFADKDANYIGSEQHDENGESFIGIVISGAFKDPNNSVIIKNNDSTYTASATLYVSSAAESTARIYSVYIRPDGSRYADPNYDIQFISPDSANITRTVSTKSTAVSSGKSKSQEFIYSVHFVLHDPCKNASVTEMDSNNNVLMTTDLDLAQPGKSAESPYSYVTMPEAAYVIVDETSDSTQNKSHRTIYSRESKFIVKPAEHSILLPADEGLLVPVPLQITFG